MNFRRQRTLVIVIYKTFKLRNTEKLTCGKYNLNLGIPKPNQTFFAKRSLRSYGPKIWNTLPYHRNT